jgi:hypothetical protein
MFRLVICLTLSLGFWSLLHAQEQEELPPNEEMQRQEIINLEKETARAIQLNNGTFFRRVYGEDFSGTLSHGQAVNKGLFIDAVQDPTVKYESFSVSDIKIRIFKNTAVATCLWSSRSIYRKQRISSQMRVMHVYINGQRGWQVVASQATILPPDVQQPL